jgi:hypothetical protein
VKAAIEFRSVSYMQQWGLIALSVAHSRVTGTYVSVIEIDLQILEEQMMY